MHAENISKDSIAKNDYPIWLYEVFYKFSLIYADAWSRNMPTEIEKQALMKLYFDALKNFKAETIQKAVDRHIALYKYPELHQLFALCDEFSKTNRYNELQIESQPQEFKKSRMPDELREKVRNLQK